MVLEIKPVKTPLEQVRMPGFWDAWEETKAEFERRLGPEEIAACSGQRVCVDVETNGLRWEENDIIGVGIHCPDAGITGYMPTLSAKSREQARQAVQSWNPDTWMVAHNIKFEMHFLRRSPELHLIDTTTMVHLIDSRLSKKLEVAEQQFLGTNTKREHVQRAPKGKRKKIWEWPIPLTADYCINDAVVEYQLATVLAPHLRHLGLMDLFVQQMEYAGLIWRVEHRGILMDVDFIERALKRFTQDQEDAEKELFDAIGYEFNWRSPTQLSKALYEDYGWERPQNPFADADGVDWTRFATKGKYNDTLTDSFILMEKAQHPLGGLVLHLRETKKMLDYLQNESKHSGFLELMDGDRVLHTNFNYNGTRTGRLSSSAPNLQNIPSEIRSRETQSVYSGDTGHRIEEYNIRLALVARPGFKLVGIDYKQMEMRMFGVLAQDPRMLEALVSGTDIHAYIAGLVWGEPVDDVHREWAKTIGFGLIYGMTLGSLQFRLNMTHEQAQAVVDQYWGVFPRIKPWLQEIIDECKANGYVRYWSGRIWREENEMDMFKGANAVVQGGSADLLSEAALRCQALLDEHGWGYIVSFIHDEIMFELHEDCLAEAIPVLAKTMEMEDKFSVPFFTDAKVGLSYGTMEKWTPE